MDTNISSIYKILILLLCLCSITHKKVNVSKLYQVLCVGVWIVVEILTQYLLDQAGIGENLNQFIRMIMPFTIYIYFLLQEKKARNVCKYLENIILFYIWFYPLSIIIPELLHIGYSSYNGGFGAKGFYYAGNEITMVMIIVGIFSFQKYLNSKTVVNFACFTLNLISVLMLGTKTAYITVLIVTLVYFCVDSNFSKKMKRIVVVLPVIIILLAFIVTKTDLITQLIEFLTLRFKYMIEGKYENEALAFLMSGRNARTLEAYKSLLREQGFSGLIFGRGYYYWVEKKNMLTEMDLCDVILWYGLAVTIIIVGIIFIEIKNYWKRFNIYTKIIILTITAGSILAGHVLFAPSVSNLLSIVLVYNIISIGASECGVK